ncbi:MAG: hypothetical protein UHY90_11255 [Treponema sp.]|nr:hypothetical protein [Spirochaetia bacterium]MDD7459682.1 hypothetical protein [Spirochaetales bacterium]MDY5811674.1 hypothetical protein [Treponema sp.]MEE1182811.1 hypothetical protein [Treponema sp.]
MDFPNKDVESCFVNFLVNFSKEKRTIDEWILNKQNGNNTAQFELCCKILNLCYLTLLS